MLDLKFYSLKVILVLLTGSVLINIILIIRIFDISVSFDYAKSENKNLKNQKKEIIQIIEKLSNDLTESKLKVLASELSSEKFIVKIKDSEIQIGGIVFKYSGDKLLVNELSQIK